MIPAIAVGAGAIAQWISGIGFSLVCAPILIASLGAREGVRVALVLSSVLNIALAHRHRADVMVREGALLLVPAMAITPFAAAAVQAIDPRWVAAAAGGLTILSAAALAAGLRSGRAANPAGAVAAGVLSGTMNVIGSIGGPALAMYSVNAGWSPARMRATLQVIFLLSNLVALAALGLPRPEHLPGPAAGLLVGWVAGRWLGPRVPDRVARAGTLAVAAAGGAAVLVRALLA